MRFRHNAPSEKKQDRRAIALARAFCGLEVDGAKLPEPFAAVIREVIDTKGDKVVAYTSAAQSHGLPNPDALLQSAIATDPQSTLSEDKPIDVITADTLLTTHYPEPVWAVPGILPTGLTILAGAPKLGKSWLALQIALSVASGGITFGERVLAGAVLYLALEDSPRRLQARMQKQAWTRGLPAEFLPLGKFDNEIGDLTNGGGERLANQIARRGYRLVVIDTLSRSIHGDQNDSEQMTRGLTPIQEIAHAQNTALLLIDHHRKGTGENVDAIGDILGSTAKGAMADTVWGLYRERGLQSAKLSITGREVEEKTIALTMDWLTGCWQSEGNADTLTLTERRQEILDALKELGNGNYKKIAQAVGQDPSNTRKRLIDMVMAGLIIREGELYSLK